MNFNTALAHKLAAWIERGLIRDLYDAYYLFVVLHAKPDLKVLKQRLAHVEGRKKNVKPTAMSIDAFIAKLEFTHYAEGPRFCRGMNAPSATGCRHSLFLLIEQKEFFGAADSCRRGSTANSLTAEMVKNGLKDYMQREELAGLDKKIIGGIAKLVEFLRK